MESIIFLKSYVLINWEAELPIKSDYSFPCYRNDIEFKAKKYRGQFSNLVDNAILTCVVQCVLWFLVFLFLNGQHLHKVMAKNLCQALLLVLHFKYNGWQPNIFHRFLKLLNWNIINHPILAVCVVGVTGKAWKKQFDLKEKDQVFHSVKRIVPPNTRFELHL